MFFQGGGDLTKNQASAQLAADTARETPVAYSDGEALREGYGWEWY